MSTVKYKNMVNTLKFTVILTSKNGHKAKYSTAYYNNLVESLENFFINPRHKSITIKKKIK